MHFYKSSGVGVLFELQFFDWAALAGTVIPADTSSQEILEEKIE